MTRVGKGAPGYNPAVASWILRIGLAAVFAYAAVDAFREPDAWISFIPHFTTRFIDAKASLDAISVVQLFLVLWLLSGKFLKYASVLAILLLGGIMVTNFSTFLVTFRDIGLIAAAGALIFLDA